MKVLITDKINESAGKLLDGVAEAVFLPTMSEDELCNIIGEYDALMVRSQTKVTKKIIDAGKNLKIIGRAGVGVDNIDIEAATQKGILVVNSPDGNTNAAAEHTIALMLAMSRNVPTAAISTKAGNWERSKFTGVEVFGKTLGIIGFGKIGSHVAKVAIALGMNVLVSDPYTSEQTVEKAGAKYVRNLDDLWGVCDYITVHVPKTRETLHLINRDTISKMKKGVRLINCARGGIIDEPALKEALESGQVASAAIDVYENEPDMSKCPLCSCNSNVVLTPHLGASTKEAQINVAIDVAEQIRDV
ncbi:MAG: hydroxyacid dehydrogenase, partial [Candidatus Gastranaerophilaceae bacterium]